MPGETLAKHLQRVLVDSRDEWSGEHLTYGTPADRSIARTITEKSSSVVWAANCRACSAAATCTAAAVAGIGTDHSMAVSTINLTSLSISTSANAGGYSSLRAFSSHVFLAPPEDHELSLLRLHGAPGDGRIEHRDAFAPSRLVQAARGAWVHGAHLDHNRAGPRARQRALWSEHHLLQRGVVCDT